MGELGDSSNPQLTSPISPRRTSEDTIMTTRTTGSALAASLSLLLSCAAGVTAQSAAATLGEAKARAAAMLGEEEAEYLLIAASSMEKVMPDRAAFTGRPGRAVEIAVAGGEIESAQVIIAPLSRSLEGVQFALSPLTGPGGAILPLEAVTLAPVGYVHTDSAKLFYEVERTGWFPDPILPFVDRFDVSGERVQTLWLSIRCPEGQARGVYTGVLTVQPENAPARTIPVHVRVFGFTIPRERSLPTILGVFVDHLEGVYGDEWNEAIYWRYAEFLHSNRVNMDFPYRVEGPPPMESEIRRLVAAGQDAWGLRFIRQAGRGWSDTGPDPAEYAVYLDQAITDARARLEVLERAGGRELAYLYLFDEVREQHFPLLLETAGRLRRELPGVPILTSANDRRFGATSGLDTVIDVWVAIIAHFNKPEVRADIERVRARGARVFWYTTIWPPAPYPNFFLEYDAIEPRLLMGAMARKFRPDGFGYWAINFWIQDETDRPRPIVEGPYTAWNPRTGGPSHGEGSWIYPGRDGPITSIRFENFRDGLEDFEYYHLLEVAIAEAASAGAAADLIDESKARLAVPDNIVRSLTDFTRSPDALEQHRLEIAETIEHLRSRLPGGLEGGGGSPR